MTSSVRVLFPYYTWQASLQNAHHISHDYPNLLPATLRVRREKNCSVTAVVGAGVGLASPDVLEGGVPAGGLRACFVDWKKKA